jgi:formate dehydrogenase subunit gamma
LSRAVAWDPEIARRLIAEEQGRARAFLGADGETATALLPILHALQDAFGCLHGEATPLIAGALNISKAEVHGAISFYHDYRSAPAAAHRLKICRAESCQAMGANRLVAHLKARHGLEPDGDGDPRLMLEDVYCLGLCALSPAALYDGQPVGRLDEGRLDGLIAEARP